MKTKLLSFLVILLSLSVNAQRRQTVYATLVSYQDPNAGSCYEGYAGYFDLTLANSQFLPGQNLSDYTFSSYRIENDFGPLPPVTPINNFRSCGTKQISVFIRKISNPSITLTGIITLVLIERAVPKPIHYYAEKYLGPEVSQSGNYFYTNDYSAIGDGSIAGATYVGVAFNAYYTGNVAGTIPIYRYFHPGVVNHFYTRDYLGSTFYGLIYESIEFYAYNYQFPGTVPVHRYYNPTLHNHYYTTDAYPYSGYTYEGVEFYAFPANANAYKEATNSEETAISKIESTPIKLFPNPTTGQVTINNDSKIIESVIVNDILGKTVQTKTINDKTAQLDLSDLSKGIYYVKVKSEGAEKVIKVVKE
jgi:hypothetical protein